ncbi:hypothetical protein M9H77_31633 [Catharanthus roseus]|uniref:Uncharacterized protein n=1 Tax=Catharanthus roseus TaxID=4058 RepID=A0ACC0A105_CATRO|nr:hypothetical protein M9H77_31633 [Catharanthus roseus]
MALLLHIAELAAAADRRNCRVLKSVGLEDCITEEEVAAMGAPMPNDLELTSTISGGLSCGRLYGLWIATLLFRSGVERIIRRVEAVVSRVGAAFDVHMRQFAE